MKFDFLNSWRIIYYCPLTWPVIVFTFLSMYLLEKLFIWAFPEEKKQDEI